MSCNILIFFYLLNYFIRNNKDYILDFKICHIKEIKLYNVVLIFYHYSIKDKLCMQALKKKLNCI